MIHNYMHTLIALTEFREICVLHFLQNLTRFILVVSATVSGDVNVAKEGVSVTALWCFATDISNNN